MIKRKILIISPETPFPLRSGADLAQHFFLEQSADDIEFTFCTKVYDNHHYFKALEYRNINKNITLLIFDRRPAKFSVLSLKIFIAKIFNIRDKSVKSGEFTYKPYSDFIDHDYVKFINNIIKEKSIDVVQFEFLRDANMAEFIDQKINKIIIHHEIWYKAVQIRSQRSGLFSAEEINNLQTEELKILSNFNKIVVFNQNDLIELQSKIPTYDIVLSPYGIPNSEICKKEISDNFKNLLFIGNESHIPNEQGLTWFIYMFLLVNYDIYDYNLIVIGNWSDNYKDKYKKYSKIKFLGTIENLAPYYEDSIMVAPITSGSGLRTKILIALANRLPVLTTRFAAEGLFDEENNKHLLFFDNEEEWANILTSDHLRNTLRAKAELGNTYFQSYFSKDILLKNRFSLYE